MPGEFMPLAESVPIGDSAQAGQATGQARVGSTTAPRRAHGGGFHQLVHARSAGHAAGHARTGQASQAANSAATRHAGAHRAGASHATTTHSAPASGASAHQPSADAALTQAMSIEAVPDSWHAGLEFIMMQESGGKVGARNPASSARGLFQLTASNYHLNPHGVHSFGNAVEEAQGGIRYIEERYGTVDNAVAHWRYRHSY
jgi:hypothetical protein